LSFLQYAWNQFIFVNFVLIKKIDDFFTRIFLHESNLLKAENIFRSVKR